MSNDNDNDKPVMHANKMTVDEAQRLAGQGKTLNGSRDLVGLKPTGDQLPIVVKAGEETFVPLGMTMAPGVVPHPDQETYPGVLVMEHDHSVVVRWHNRGCGRVNTSLAPGDVKFDIKGAPWCPTCFAQNLHNNPNWNTPKDGESVVTPTPLTSPDDPGRQSRHAAKVEAMRRARAEGRYRNPIGDDQIIYPEPRAGDLSFVKMPEKKESE